MMYGEIIKSIRISAGLTQEHLAEILNVSRSLITKYERNIARPDLSTISQIMTACDSNIMTFAVCMVLHERLDNPDAQHTISRLHSPGADYDTGSPAKNPEADAVILSLLRMQRTFTDSDMKIIKDYLIRSRSGDLF